MLDKQLLYVGSAAMQVIGVWAALISKDIGSYFSFSASSTALLVLAKSVK